jgi:hypothetical protein
MRPPGPSVAPAPERRSWTWTRGDLPGMPSTSAGPGLASQQGSDPDAGHRRDRGTSSESAEGLPDLMCVCAGAAGSVESAEGGRPRLLPGKPPVGSTADDRSRVGRGPCVLVQDWAPASATAVRSLWTIGTSGQPEPSCSTRADAGAAVGRIDGLGTFGPRPQPVSAARASRRTLPRWHVEPVERDGGDRNRGNGGVADQRVGELLRH